MIVCIVAPIHPYNDVRIYKKEAITISKIASKVIVYAQTKNIDEEIESGIEIIAAPKIISRFQRLFNQPKILVDLIKTKSDVYHLHNPDMLLIGFILRILNKKVIYDTHEDFSERIKMRKWIPKLIRPLIAKIVFLLEKATAYTFEVCIVTQSRQVKKIGGKSILIENAPVNESKYIDHAFKLSLDIKKEKDVFYILYAGSISDVRGIRETIKALEIVNKEINCKLWLIGSVFDPNLIKELEKEKGWEYVEYKGYLTQSEAFAYMIKADIGMVTILDVGDHAMTSPNKLYEYQRFGLPFISSDFKKWKEQVGEINSGVFVDPLNIKEIANNIIKLLLDYEKRGLMSANGKEYIKQIYNWDIESKKLIGIYQKIKEDIK